ncbi:uncharacterized protein K460DRAFT_370101 [Cucurbitaria berberidis CBS 394.84]|uniref:BTB domain-containing protein n=1 Tax=Cucurbitaria berberidis CBS 394.84 TaxID=1168544 RepID=A0A9P4GB06_9PLEO|nr:uncharacterized protein K460DRAFT_370101 [Cucurbitaria berberidis CBS 394.84]KAF1842096.1 hypothetical protein K460DRAFT_370101 [Cucurbitaria berberidis CBS 394.84]
MSSPNNPGSIGRFFNRGNGTARARGGRGDSGRGSERFWGTRRSFANDAFQPANSTQQASASFTSGISGGAISTLSTTTGQPGNTGLPLPNRPPSFAVDSTTNSGVQAPSNAPQPPGDAGALSGPVPQAASIPPNPTATDHGSRQPVAADIVNRTVATLQVDTIGIPRSPYTARISFGTRSGRLQLQLLKGPGIDVVIGPRDALSLPKEGTEAWSLPRALICHYSPYLEAACTRDFRECQENYIKLPEDDPKIFDLFVEWMYYNEYTLTTRHDEELGRIANSNSEAWVLGDKLLSTDFKNYAMSRLYAQYATDTSPKPIRTIDVKYAYLHSAANSPLRRFFFDLVVAHFNDRARVVDTTEEWWQVMKEYVDFGELLLGVLRTGTDRRHLIKDKDIYMEKVHETSENMITPAKRDADGRRVKREPTSA